MNKSYLIVPVVLLAVFAVLYNGALKEMKTKADQQQATADAKTAEENKHKAEVEARAQIDAKKHQEERDAADRAKEEKRIKEYEDQLKALKDEANKYNTEADKLSKEAADLELQISQARTDKEKLNTETFDIAKEIELTKINRRNAELEIQRMIDMLGKKLTASSIILPPPPPPLPVGK